MAFERRRNIVVDTFRETPELKLDPPGGAFYVFSGSEQGIPAIYMISSGDRSASRVFAKILLEKYDVAVVPGIAFGDDNGMRLSFALGDDAFKKGPWTNLPDGSRYAIMIDIDRSKLQLRTGIHRGPDPRGPFAERSFEEDLFSAGRRVRAAAGAGGTCRSG